MMCHFRVFHSADGRRCLKEDMFNPISGRLIWGFVRWLDEAAA
jgi:hypothetical protein